MADTETEERTGQAEPGLLERLRQRTSPVRQAARGPEYNHPYAWYARPDGDVVYLPGDPQNRAYYEDKGYAVLRREEAREWEAEVRPAVLGEQREKASLITTIRRIERRNPGIDLVADLDAMTIAELRELLEEVGQAAGVSTKVVGRQFARPAAEAADPLMRGVTIASGAELHDKIERDKAYRGRRGRGPQGEG
jgi:hypothetical protein